jgi:ankyrin repeat protein
MNPLKKRKTKLFKAIFEGKWREVVLRSNEKEARYFHAVSYDDRPELVRMLPLHFACLFGPTVEAIEALIASYPDALHQRDSTFNRTPLHMAILKSASPEVIERLLVADRDSMALKCRDRVGRLPLHYAICTRAPAKVMQQLLEAYPEGAKVQDFNGWLPFHVGCSYGMSDEVFACLYRCYPGSIHVTTKRGSLTPIDCAQRSGRQQEYQKLTMANNRVIAPIAV